MGGSWNAASAVFSQRNDDTRDQVEPDPAETVVLLLAEPLDGVAAAGIEDDTRELEKYCHIGPKLTCEVAISNQLTPVSHLQRSPICSGEQLWGSGPKVKQKCAVCGQSELTALQT